MKWKNAFALLLIALFVALPAVAGAPATPHQQEQPQAPEPPDKVAHMKIPEAPVVSTGSITLNGKSINYEATTGFTDLFDDEEKPQAKIFSVSYVAKSPVKLPRPVTFIYNGGPGSATIFTHIGAFGPRTFPSSGDGTTMPVPPYSLAENPDCILDVTDMVFVDPVGTGYSRGVSKEASTKFWAAVPDAASIGSFICQWLNTHERWGSPVYLAGESYGGLRTGLLSEGLNNMGIIPSGLILISPAMDMGELNESQGNDRPSIHLVPVMAASAWFHHRLSAELQKLPAKELRQRAAVWARDVYMPALWQGGSLPAEKRQAIAQQLSNFIGISTKDILAANLRPSPSDFAGLLLRDQNKFLSLYDGRMTGIGTSYSYASDPSFVVSGAPFMTAFMDYLRKDLKFHTDRTYETMNEEANRKWNYESVSGHVSVPPESTDRLQVLLKRAPFVKVMVASGLYDMVTPLESAVYSISRMDLPAEQLSSFEYHEYEGGHMFYMNPSAHHHLAADLRAFYAK